MDAGLQARLDFPAVYRRVDRIKRQRGWRPWWWKPGNQPLRVRALDAMIPRHY